MMKEIANSKNVENIKIFIQGDPNICQAVLFGSYAQGEQTAGSDIDIAIQLVKPMVPKQKLYYIEKIQECTGADVDLVDLVRDGQPLLSQILKYGKRLKGSSLQYAELAIKNVNTAQDFLPCIKRLMKEGNVCSMDSVILDKKIDSILRCLTRIEQRLPMDEVSFMLDYDAQDVVVLNITRAVQLSVDIATHVLSTGNEAVPDTMSDAFVKLHRQGLFSKQVAEKMIKSVGYRNVAVHSYDDVDLSITYEIARDHLQDFKNFIKEIRHDSFTSSGNCKMEL